MPTHDPAMASRRTGRGPTRKFFTIFRYQILERSRGAVSFRDFTMRLSASGSRKPRAACLPAMTSSERLGQFWRRLSVNVSSFFCVDAPRSGDEAVDRETPDDDEFLMTRPGQPRFSSAMMRYFAKSSCASAMFVVLGQKANGGRSVLGGAGDLGRVAHSRFRFVAERQSWSAFFLEHRTQIAQADHAWCSHPGVAGLTAVRYGGTIVSSPSADSGAAFLEPRVPPTNACVAGKTQRGVAVSSGTIKQRRTHAHV